jgi:hypothetical protein
MEPPPSQIGNTVAEAIASANSALHTLATALLQEPHVHSGSASSTSSEVVGPTLHSQEVPASPATPLASAEGTSEAEGVIEVTRTHETSLFTIRGASTNQLVDPFMDCRPIMVLGSLK